MCSKAEAVPNSGSGAHSSPGSKNLFTAAASVQRRSLSQPVLAVRWLTEGVKVLGAPQFKAWILSALLKRTGLARRLGLLLLWRLVPWLSETLGLGSLLYPWPLLRCPGERGAYLGCYRLQPSSHPPSQETLGNGGSDKLVLVVNRICFARHFTL